MVAAFIANVLPPGKVTRYVPVAKFSAYTSMSVVSVLAPHPGRINAALTHRREPSRPHWACSIRITRPRVLVVNAARTASCWSLISCSTARCSPQRWPTACRRRWWKGHQLDRWQNSLQVESVIGAGGYTKPVGLSVCRANVPYVSCHCNNCLLVMRIELLYDYHDMVERRVAPAAPHHRDGPIHIEGALQLVVHRGTRRRCSWRQRFRARGSTPSAWARAPLPHCCLQRPRSALHARCAG